MLKILFLTLLGMAVSRADVNITSGQLDGIPVPVLGAAQRVLQVHTIGFGGSYVVKLAASDTAQSSAQALHTAGQTFEAQQIEFCALTKQKMCRVHTEQRVATAFALVNSNTLITNYHVLLPSLVDAFKSFPSRGDVKQLLKYFAQQNLFIKLTDSTGEEVFSALRSPQTLNVKSLNSSILLLANEGRTFDGNFYAELSDVVVLNNSKAPLQPLTLADKLPARGDTVYTAGYPRGPKPAAGDENTRVLRISTGRLLTPEEFLSAMNQKEDEQFVHLRHEYMLFADFWCDEGSSGGPILNAKGAVIGVVAGFYDNPRNHKRICYGANLLALDKLREFWESTSGDR